MWCWWCCHDFACTPLSMPYRYHESTKKFFTCGHFCSWSCMKSYALDMYGINRGGIICGNIVLMRKRMFHKLGPIKPAPKRFRLVEFGGDLTIEEFRMNSDTDIVTPAHIHTEPTRQIAVTNVKKMNDIKNSTTTNDALKLKRSKPLAREVNNLETALGLKIKKLSSDS